MSIPIWAEKEPRQALESAVHVRVQIPVEREGTARANPPFELCHRLGRYEQPVFVPQSLQV
jgi:hypothetical protein